MKEIELLKIIFKDSPDILNPLNEIDKEIERLNSIIKEVREYIKNDDNFFIIDAYSQPIVDRIQEDILEILDKENI